MPSTLVYRKFDAGAGQKERHSKADCTVRALATATGMRYVEAWHLLYTLQGEKHHCFFSIFDYLRAMPERMGVKRYLAFPAQKGMPRTKVRDFVRAHSVGSFIVQAAHHATAVEDGVLLDTWDCGRKAIYGAWEMKRG